MPPRDAPTGFSIIELLVSITIIVIVSGVVLVSHSRFGGSVLLTNLAYDVALSIRQAQVYGLAVREFDPSGPSATFETSYGVWFNKDNPTTYVLFADYDGDSLYNGTAACTAGDLECVTRFTIGRGNTIAQFCGIVSTLPLLVQQCSGSGPGTIQYLNIIFDRPNPDAIVLSDLLPVPSEGGYDGGARIVLRSPQGLQKTVLVGVTGQISVLEGQVSVP